MFKQIKLLSIAGVLLCLSSYSYADDTVQITREEFDSLKMRVVQAENAAKRAEDKADEASRKAADSIGFSLQAQRMANAAMNKNRP